MFPSPCGEKVGINEKELLALNAQRSAFPSPCGEKVGINPGCSFLSRKGGKCKFPSPCGEKVGINSNTGSRSPAYCIEGCFRPLAGKR